MNFIKNLSVLVLLTLLFGCKKSETTPTSNDTMYFPSNADNNWETVSISSLGWKENAVQPLKEYLSNTDAKSFMILANGRIVMEEYFNGHTPTSTWEWNSAGKTLVASMVGIAQQEGFLNINDKVADYLGTGWSSEPIEKENLITIRHLLTMTSGLNDESQLIIKPNLTYLADAGARWSYSNVFQLLMDVVEAASNQDFKTYCTKNLKDKIGMEGFWNYGVIFKIYHSTTRSMARFGLLALNKGKWDAEQIINEAFFNECINSSQSINPAYGYLWWLNGKSNYMVPGGQEVYQGHLVPNAPADMYSAMGARDQRVYIVPSKNIVVVRMGAPSNPDHPTFAVSGFDNDLWGKIDALIN